MFEKLWINAATFKLDFKSLITIWDPFECIKQIYYTDMEIWLLWKFFLNPNYLFSHKKYKPTLNIFCLIQNTFSIWYWFAYLKSQPSFMSFDVVSEFRDTTQKTVLVISIGLNTHFSIEWWHFIQSSQWFFHFSVANESTRTLKFWC